MFYACCHQRWYHIWSFCLNSDPVYFWQQTSEDITVSVRLPMGVTKEEVNFRLTADNISIGVLGSPPALILEGQLYESVDPQASTWIFKNDKRFVQFYYIRLKFVPFSRSCHTQVAPLSINPRGQFPYPVRIYIKLSHNVMCPSYTPCNIHAWFLRFKWEHHWFLTLCVSFQCGGICKYYISLLFPLSLLHLLEKVLYILYVYLHGLV